MRHLTNTYDPRLANAKMHVLCLPHQTHEDAWREHQKWLKDKIIGEPKATSKYTVDELKKMGMVGVYVSE